jgi:hypothetical protein
VLLSAITTEPTTTSDLYDRIGYPALTSVGLIPYRAFRAELVKLSAAGLASSEEAPDGSTVWWREDPGPQAPSGTTSADSSARSLPTDGT